jgi:salicylate hydroxylase
VRLLIHLWYDFCFFKLPLLTYHVSLKPCCTHGASLAVEDAVVLGTLLSRLHSHEQIPQLLEAFQDLRQDRCTFVHTSEIGNAALCRMPPGEDRDARDAHMRHSIETGEEHWDEGALLEQWESISEVFAYNAREDAEDWWWKWGVLGDSSQVDGAFGMPEPFEMKFEVTTVQQKGSPESS